MARIYLDANVYIYYFDAHPRFGPIAEDLLKRLVANNDTIVSSCFCVGEVLVRPVLLQQEFNIARISRFFRLPGILMVDLPVDSALFYAKIRANSRVKAMDALHLACAAHAGCDVFLTNDKDLLGLDILGIGQIASLDL